MSDTDPQCFVCFFFFNNTATTEIYTILFVGSVRCVQETALDLTYQIRNIKRDLANGFIIAEIISRYYPSLFDINKFNTSNGLREKKMNWEFIAKLLQKKEILEKHGEFKLDKREYEPIMAIAPDSGFNFLLRLYEFLTRKKLLNQQKMTMTDKRIQEVIIPSYAQQTASTLARDRELVRIVNANEKQFRTQNAISSHIEKQRHERANQNLVEYILMKRRKQMEEELRKQALELSKKQKENVELHAPEIKEIPVKSFNTQNNKKKELEGLAEGREIVEQLSKIALPLMEQDPIKKELSELKDVDKISKVELILMNATEFSEKSLQLIIMAMKENINVIVEYLHNNYADFKRFFKIMLACIRTINFGIQPFALLIDFIKQVGTELTLLDPSSCQLLFESIALEEIVDIIKMYQNKRNQLITVLYAFGHQDSLSRLRLVRKIKDHLGKDLNSFFSILAYLVNLSCEAEMDDDFYNLFLFYSIMAIEFASPIARTNGLKILTEICRISYFQILNLLSKFEKLLDDDWWEVKAQILIICARLLLILWQENPNEMLNQQQQEDYDDYEQQQQQQQNQIEKFQQQEEIKEESQLQNTEDDIKLNEQQQQAQQNSMSQTLDEQLGQLNMENNEERLEKLKQQKEKNQQILIDFIYHIFESNQSENILRIGLIYLAPVINYYPEICDRYLEIILLIQEDIREQILIINPYRAWRKDKQLEAVIHLYMNQLEHPCLGILPESHNH
eukprot:TRINITY_DN708_c0_g1_i1.p1 TRINITY_DN708_c0_g1~~TRINITY_DN708_c0_g1_i1.p1  ORF type:complete len:736 (+),score=116.88 TRINITY_DN708_c0_g1_i1:25-2232(+)